MRSRPRDVLRWVWAVLLMATGGLHRARRNIAQRRAIVVLAFHRVLEDSDFRATRSLPGMTMRRRTFDRLAAYVTRRYEVVSLPGSAPGEATAGERIAFTFDDGWIDNYALLRVMREHGISATIFVCPALVDRSEPFWPERIAGLLKAAFPSVRRLEIDTIINRLKPCPNDVREEAVSTLRILAGGEPVERTPDRTMSWGQIKELNLAGVTIGSHTATHRILTAIPEDIARQEIVNSKNCLETELDRPCSEFAYPNGDHSEPVRRLLMDAGTQHAFTVNRGAWLPGSDPLAIPRVNVAEEDVTGPVGRFSAAMFEYTTFWKASRALHKR